MKYRLTAYILLFSFVLASCSLAEDITPPPGYLSPTSAPSVANPTQAPQLTLTAIPATVSPDTSPASTQLTTPSAGVTATPGAFLGNISGSLVNGSGGAIPDGQKVTLEGFDKDQSGTFQNALELVAAVDPKGSYNFNDVEMPQGRAFIIITSWGGVEYQSDPVIVSTTTTDFTIPITIYEKTKDSSTLSLNQVHLIFALSTQNVLQVTELFIVTNPGKQVVLVSSDGTSIPFIHTPSNAGNVQFQLSQGSAQLLNATGGFAMVPGANKQYGFIATYTLPYTNSLKFEQPFSMPVSSLTVFLPQGMRIRGEQLTDAGPQDIQGQSYQMYQVNNMASGSSLSMTLSGKPGTATANTLSKQTWVLIGIGVVGVLLIGLGVYLYLHDRARQRKENELEENQEEMSEDAIGEDRDSIMDSMIALDDQYKAGEIPKEAYENRRNELKQRLKAVY
jgi:hypothetical protein